MLIVDDFFRGGGTLNGMASLVDIFKSEVVGAYVLCEYIDNQLSQKINPKSLILIKSMDIDKGEIELELGTLFIEK
ncbi:hypothetical protein CKO19_16930 [Rhodovulum adriaticum]|nr:hypothetical protein [Rhodovulum adriaticum]